MRNLLLVGNGPNYFSAGVSWADVVRATARKVRLANQTERLIHEPLPLVYESIASQHPDHEKQARTELALQMRRLRPNRIHEALMGLGWATVLTTNYDYCLEEASGEKFTARNLAPESMYSVFRRRSSPRRSVWHIHGDFSGPRTMLLGMHYYAGYLQKLRAYLTNRAQQSPFVFGDRSHPLEGGKHSWADLFLRDHVHIVGLGLSYAEVVLWWLLGYKQRLKSLKRLPCGPTTYYYMGSDEPAEKNRLQLLMAYGVTVRIIRAAPGSPTEKNWKTLLHQLESVGG